MTSEEEKRFRELLVQMGRVSRAGQRGITLALRGAPRCHYLFLERLHSAVEHCGKDGWVRISDLTAVLHETPPAISRALRTLEQDGLTRRTTDPEDRRKTFVGLTPEGEAARLACEQELRAYFCAVIDDLGLERSEQLCRDMAGLSEALERQNKELGTR